VANVLFLFNIN